MAEMPLLSPLPRPVFFDNPPLSTKRESQRRGLIRRIPRAVRSVQSIGRYLTENYELPGPHFISFKRPSEGAPTSGKTYYDPDDAREYFEQCFESGIKIGEGSFGEVFRVKCKVDGKLYAVKRTMVPFRNRRDRDMKLREVKMHELLPKHPNLVEFIRAWEEKGQLYIQTELCEYSLAHYAEHVHSISEDLLWSFFADIIAAVYHLHQNDFLHLDIKPDNIFMSDGVCKLGDFGLVVDLKEESSNVAQDGDSRYLAQEVLNNPPRKPADIFSVGISMLELASDMELPSSGDGWHMVREGRIPLEFIKDIPPKLYKMISSMIHLDPEKRPTAFELYSDSTIQKYLKKRNSCSLVSATPVRRRKLVSANSSGRKGFRNVRCPESFPLRCERVFDLPVVNPSKATSFNQKLDVFNSMHESGLPTEFDWILTASRKAESENSCRTKRPNGLKRGKASVQSESTPKYDIENGTKRTHPISPVSSRSPLLPARDFNSLPGYRPLRLSHLKASRPLPKLNLSFIENEGENQLNQKSAATFKFLDREMDRGSSADELDF